MPEPDSKAVPTRIRCKFVLESVTGYAAAPPKAVFRAQDDPAIPEDQRFTRKIPTGSLEVTIDNPHALGELKPGRAFYLDLTPA